ncbi:hypothetical protein Dvina_51460 [Dactylosporangium vinaceum]|uniref:Uncharacterized protein n=1 Tax=Dactylosporangium vinaceum TaxID=53362 RepID=A0ABV5M2J5_9ACTN|nr:hypothetical protein [Dactylosporangium vinaceum]UAB96265.1 hypothetical protein Dvina_51460 [Dactylosporangium vinaceum]
MLIVISSVKGAPGVTTLAVGLAALWPEPDAVLVEADPAGGDLAARFGHSPEPGLTGLAAQAHTGTLASLAPFTQRLAVGADVVLAPAGETVAASTFTLATRGLQALRRLAEQQPVLVDVGRLEQSSPAAGLLGVADHVLVLADGELAAQTQVEARLGWVRSVVTGRLWLVRTGAGGYPGREIARDLGVPVLWELPDSQLGAGALAGRLRAPAWRRLRLARAVRGVALTLTTAQPASILAAEPVGSIMSTDPAVRAHYAPPVAAVPPVIQAAAHQPRAQQRMEPRPAEQQSGPVQRPEPVQVRP